MSLDSEGKGHTVLFKNLFYYECIYFLCYGCFACICLVPAEAEVELQTVESLDAGTGIEPGPLQEESVLLTTDFSLQPRCRGSEG